MALKILIVDDSSTILKLYQKLLPDIFEDQIELIEAKDGVEAFEKLETNHDVEMIFSDVNMPRMKGDEFVQRVRSIQIYNTIKIIMVTTEAEKSFVNKMINIGLNGFIVKPFNEEKLKKVIENITARMSHIKLKNSDTLSEHIKFLLVDDSSTARKSLMQKISNFVQQPIDYIEASDGIEALEILAKRDDIMCIFSDVNMPKMKGDEFLYKVRENPKYNYIKVIMATTENEISFMKQMIHAGANGYVIKPFKDDGIHRALKNALGREEKVTIK